MSYSDAMPEVNGMLPTRRVAAYAVCIDQGRVLLAFHVPRSGGEGTWTLPGGRVEHGEDPFDAVIREVAEETGYEAVVERLLGVDSRAVPGTDRRPASVWTRLDDVAALRRSSLVDVGMALATTRPVTGHVEPVPVGGLVRH